MSGLHAGKPWREVERRWPGSSDPRGQRETTRRRPRRSPPKPRPLRAWERAHERRGSGTPPRPLSSAGEDLGRDASALEATGAVGAYPPPGHAADELREGMGAHGRYEAEL